jgi:hypothetical protein
MIDKVGGVGGGVALRYGSAWYGWAVGSGQRETWAHHSGWEAVPLPKKKALMAMEVSMTPANVAMRWGRVMLSCRDRGRRHENGVDILLWEYKAARSGHGEHGMDGTWSRNHGPTILKDLHAPGCPVSAAGLQASRAPAEACP